MKPFLHYIRLKVACFSFPRLSSVWITTLKSTWAHVHITRCLLFGSAQPHLGRDPAPQVGWWHRLSGSSPCWQEVKQCLISNKWDFNNSEAGLGGQKTPRKWRTPETWRKKEAAAAWKEYGSAQWGSPLSCRGVGWDGTDPKAVTNDFNRWQGMFGYFFPLLIRELFDSPKTKKKTLHLTSIELCGSCITPNSLNDSVTLMP